MEKITALSAALALLVITASPSSGADCRTVAENYAASKGGSVISVSASQSNGRTVCKVTVSIPSGDGKPPRVETTTLEG